MHFPSTIDLQDGKNNLLQVFWNSVEMWLKNNFWFFI